MRDEADRLRDLGRCSVPSLLVLASLARSTAR